MGKASSSKKVARAARAAGRPGAKKSYAWPMAIGGVVIVGVLLVVLSFSGEESNAAPRVGDHWHAAYGVYDCDGFATPFPQEAEDRTGIHTHGEGLMHIHPFTSRVSGEKANIGAFAETLGFEVDDTSFSSEALGLDRENGQKCGDETGTVKLLIWDNPADTEPTVRTKDIADYNPPDSSIWVLAFAAEGAEIGLPPSAANLQDPLAAEEGRQPVTATSQPATGATTTVPADSSGTTVPADSTTTTIPATDSTTTTAAP